MSTSIRESASLNLRRFAPFRQAYRTVFGQEGRERRRKLSAFYSQFLRPNDLVFDIGANIGVYSKVFRLLGARVVSVEPNPKCEQQIACAALNDRVIVVPAAVGAESGNCKLFVNEVSGFSSTSPSWIGNKSNGHGAWKHQIEVPMLTVSDLMAVYGMPRYIKMDVEGSEIAVLSGMTTQPEFLSLEFHGESWEQDRHCFDNLHPSTVFDFVITEPFKFEIGRWVSREEVRQTIESTSLSAFGDVFAHLPC